MSLVWHSISRYLPTPLEVLENPWIQWAVLLPRDIATPEYDVIRREGVRGLRALGLRTGLTHMEWFRRAGDDIAISEVAARPPGAQFTSLLSYAHDIDMYAAWARLEISGTFDPPERRYSVGAAYLRGQGSGTVLAVHGLDVAPARARRHRRRGRHPAPGPGARQGRTRVKGTSCCATPTPRWSKRGCAASSRSRASSSERCRDPDGADDLSRLPGRDALLHARSGSRRRSRDRRGRPAGHGAAGDGARPPRRRTGRSPPSRTRTRSCTRSRNARRDSTSMPSHRCGSRRWCSPRASANASASEG